MRLLEIVPEKQIGIRQAVQRLEQAAAYRVEIGPGPAWTIGFRQTRPARSRRCVPAAAIRTETAGVVHAGPCVVHERIPVQAGLGQVQRGTHEARADLREIVGEPDAVEPEPGTIVLEARRGIRAGCDIRLVALWFVQIRGLRRVTADRIGRSEAGIPARQRRRPQVAVG